jgi:hypothetical protein
MPFTAPPVVPDVPAVSDLAPELEAERATADTVARPLAAELPVLPERACPL